ncbi:MAG: DUF2769 domain-containing protein [Coriobacteriia bacterium]
MKVDDTDKNADRCLCPGCPTYNACMKEAEQRLYCSRGKTGCAVEPRGCICGECPVWVQYRLFAHYFCMNGAAE